MKYVICLVALLLLSSSASAAVQNWYVQANLTQTAPLVVRPTALSVPVLSEGGLLVLNVTTDVSVAVCLKNMISPSADSTWWNTTCDYYATYTPSTSAASTSDVQPSTPTSSISSSRRTFRLKKMSIRDAAQGNLPNAYLTEGYYFAGILALEPSKLGKNYAAVTVTLTGEVCEAGMVGPNCQTAVTPVKNETVSQTFASADFAYYTLEVPENTANVTVALTYNSTTATAFAGPGFSSFARKDNIPVAPGQFGNSKGAFDFAANSTQVVNSTKVDLTLAITTPAPGTWYVGVVNNEAQSVTAQVKFGSPVICKVGTAGASCQYTVSDLSSSLAKGAVITGTVNKGVWAFFSIQVPASLPSLLVNARNFESGANPHLYLRANNVPTATNYLAKDCNVAPADCSVVNKIQTFVATNGTWFVGIEGTADNQKFGVWLTTSCPNDCSSHGTCAASTGVCTCSGYTGLDCTTSDDSGGFKTVYIVLIVIGGVVLAGIIIGIIIYLRGRNAGYNPIR